MSKRQSRATVTRRPVLWLLGACATFAGCGDPTNSCTTVDSGAAGCAATAIPNGLTPFIGSWIFKTGTQTVTCGLEPAQSSMPSDRIAITPGPVPETITVDDDGCVLNYNVTGTVAAAPLGGSCDGAVVETTIEVRPDGLLHFSGVAGVELDGGACTVTVDGYLARR